MQGASRPGACWVPGCSLSGARDGFAPQLREQSRRCSRGPSADTAFPTRVRTCDPLVHLIRLTALSPEGSGGSPDVPPQYVPQLRLQLMDALITLPFHF